MKSIRKELQQSSILLILFIVAFVAVNIFLNMLVTRQNNRLYHDYQQMNSLILINNRRKTDFKLYCKSRDNLLRRTYDNDCEELDKQLDALSKKMQHDNKCKMMYRLVCQVVDHSRETAGDYMDLGGIYDTGTINYLDEVDLELERCINQLTNYYLEFLNRESLRQNNWLTLVMFAVYVVMVVVCMDFGLKNYEMNDSVLESVGKVSVAADEITRRNFEVDDIKEMTYLELYQVSGAFDHMKHTIRKMLIELQEKHQMEQHLAEAKIKELQMQMNPHFLFNSLSLVVRNIQLGEKETSIQLINSISRILRSSIEIKSMAIPLDDEIDLLQAYLYIQKLHLRGRVTFYLDVRKSFLDEDFLIPPLTIQPLVENCVKHGLKDKVKDGRVEILITEKPDHMEVVVADNGVGFVTEGEVQRSDENGERSIPKTSIGLNNVRERLKLYYRRDDVLKIERNDGFTRITLKLYRNRGEEEVK